MDPRAEPEWHSTPIDAALVRGALDLESTDQGVLPHRLPRWAREQIPDDQLAMAEAQPSGVRLAFRTAASSIELDVLPTKMAYQGAPPRPDGVYDLLVDGRLDGQATATGGNLRTTDMATGSTVTTPGPVATVVFSGLEARDKHVEIWLPHNEITELVALRTDAPTEVAPRARPPDLVAPRQLDQPRLERREPEHDLACAGRLHRWCGAGQPGVRRQRPARPVHGAGHAGHPCGPDQREDRDQPREHRPDARARLRPGCARLPGHHPGGAPHHSTAGRLVRCCARSTRTLPVPLRRTSPGSAPES